MYKCILLANYCAHVGLRSLHKFAWYLTIHYLILYIYVDYLFLTCIGYCAASYIHIVTEKVHKGNKRVAKTNLSRVFHRFYVFIRICFRGNLLMWLKLYG